MLAPRGRHVLTVLFWTDSTCVLRYIKNPDKPFHTFPANRVLTIDEKSAPEQWSPVDTECNPADASCGVLAGSLQQWLNSPEFLSQPAESWPQSQASETGEIPENDQDVKKESSVYSTQATNCESQVTKIFKKFSNWQSLKKLLLGFCATRQS